MGSQPLHAAGNSVTAIWAHAAASFICGPSGDSCSHVIRSPHEWAPAAAAHTAEVQVAVPQGNTRGSIGGEDGSIDGAGGGGGNASIEK